MADESFKARFLAKHNEYRKKHGVPAVSMSEDLCTSAQAWADHLLSIKTLQHSDTNKGENIYYFQSSAPKKLTGHFTQVVWKSTKEVGVGLATDGKTVFVVGQYEPAGNISNEGYFKDNVLPAGK
ncbi:Golgi-associated plant pathogenesis-related protein 1 isoform X2 [Tachysurus fulvidraco]|uniref:Golgi-associated plant pathogenesis-related protein 1 isoform X2 n=1 Tax=Tachysurus fulvidraco TaxID=1234273 RepID=UPI000F50F062|nr:Golgi-associated plant pathogenesis-related protein 1 isoform X2 [Tachysurus fulvidraco]